MKFTIILIISSLFICFHAGAQTQNHERRLFIVTIDGFRWQEVFTGADPALISNTQYVGDTSLNRQMFWDSTVELRRRKLMPFFWNVIAAKGQLYGNRLFKNKVNVKNFYKISYPGYNEIFTGHTNGLISPNLPIYNRNRNVLEYLDGMTPYHGKVVVFTSWNIFPYILNAPRNGLPVNSGYPQQNDPAGTTDAAPDPDLEAIRRVEDSISPKTHTRYDLLTWLNAREYISAHHPSVAFIGLGETDEFAHAGRYDLYLQKVSEIDRMLSSLWYMIQTDPYYKDNTDIIITTDHGRGTEPYNWTTHGFWAKGSGEAWLALLGPDILPEGEMKTPGQLYQRQLAATMALLLGEPDAPGHPIGKAIHLPAPAPNLLPPSLKQTEPVATVIPFTASSR